MRDRRKPGDPTPEVTTFDLSTLFPHATARAFPGGRNNVDLWNEIEIQEAEERIRLTRQIEQAELRRRLL